MNQLSSNAMASPAPGVRRVRKKPTERAGYSAQAIGRRNVSTSATPRTLLSQGLRLGSLSKLAGATSDLREALLTSRELLPLLAARGVDLRRHRVGVLLFRAPAWLTAATLAWLTTHVALARLTFQAHSDPDAEEPREICRDTLAEARRLGISVPRLAAAEPNFARNGAGRA
jgi:2-dehydropantoate 2-reductase